ncbi:MAG: nucleotide exchange factor GrpE [Candidatus Marinimicrobia bacterium]|nr:nucleotide exchange factor GrpE [Candidatus Neomarinimicrobiota bacterium]|tara:strand:+ start:10965 stop:11462 length:498 start_codon:yes stop_codon:yes gene_type:complete
MPTKKTKKNTSNKKNNDFKKKISELELELEKKNDKNIRLLAEFDNYKQRTSRLMIENNKYEGMDFIKNILSVIDDIDRVLQIKELIKNKSILDGINLIKSKFISILEHNGVVAYDSIGEEFNPDLHEALMTKKSGKKSNIVLEEYEIGYKYHDKVLRHSKVVVSE